MAEPKAPHPALQLVAIFSRHAAALDWAIAKIAQHWGAIALTSPRFEHAETSYYQAEMGPDLLKQFVVLKSLYDPSRLSADKLLSNGWEEELAQSGGFTEARPVNIDPGYITPTKIVLASAKDRAHRIYLRDGIYAEECLYYVDRRWQACAWTYPDYKRQIFTSFLTRPVLPSTASFAMAIEQRSAKRPDAAICR